MRMRETSVRSANSAKIGSEEMRELIVENQSRKNEYG